MYDHRGILLEILGPILLMLFIAVSAMFIAIPYALGRHPGDELPATASTTSVFHPT